MSVIIIGELFVFGLAEVKPLKGFPEGRVRVKLRSDEFAVALVRIPKTQKTERHLLKEKDGEWIPGGQIGVDVFVQ